MSDYLVNISPAPIVPLDHLAQFAQAAHDLITFNCVYKIPHAVATYDGGWLVEDDEKLTWLVAALEAVRPGWSTIAHASRIITPEHDIDMHGNPYDPSMLTPDYLHYHRTTEGTVTATFARAFPQYLQDELAKDCLTAALRRGMTDVRYADPATFQQADIVPGEVLVFRLSEPSGLPFLHDFQTTSESRGMEVTALMCLG